MKYGFAFFLLLTFVAHAATDHNYVYNDGFDYGYEEQGVDELVVVKYLGERNGIYQILLNEGSEHTVIECARDCRYAKIYSFWEQELEGTSAIKMRPEIIAWHAMSDAWNGKMKRFISAKGYLWVTANGHEWTANE